MTQRKQNAASDALRADLHERLDALIDYMDARADTISGCHVDYGDAVAACRLSLRVFNPKHPDHCSHCKGSGIQASAAGDVLACAADAISDPDQSNAQQPETATTNAA